MYFFRISTVLNSSFPYSEQSLREMLDSNHGQLARQLCTKHLASTFISHTYVTTFSSLPPHSTMSQNFQDSTRILGHNIQQLATTFNTEPQHSRCMQSPHSTHLTTTSKIQSPRSTHLITTSNIQSPRSTHLITTSNIQSPRSTHLITTSKIQSPRSTHLITTSKM